MFAFSPFARSNLMPKARHSTSGTSAQVKKSTSSKSGKAPLKTDMLYNMAATAAATAGNDSQKSKGF